jgi:hypothetical protein
MDLPVQRRPGYKSSSLSADEQVIFAPARASHGISARGIPVLSRGAGFFGTNSRSLG